MTEKFRAFIAIDFTDDVRNELTQFQKELKLQPELHSLKWTKPENLHITMRFLGNITPTQYNAITTALAHSLNEIEPCTVSLADLIIFPTSENPVALALKPQPIAILVKLNQLIEQAIIKCGIKPEPRPFLPHLTLAKIKPQRQLELPQIELPKLQLPVKGVTLFRSDTSMEGSQYTPLVCVAF